jgi:D-arabinose 5-phosphate isomerase GutQ
LKTKKAKDVVTWQWDYRVLTLASSIKLGPKAQRVILGTCAEYEKYVKTKTAQCVVVGMGRSGEKGGRSYAKTLQKGEQARD